MGKWQRALIVGASGQVGAALLTSILQRADERSVTCTSREPRPGWMTLDLRSFAEGVQPADQLQQLAPDLILCVGGMTFVDGCEQSPATCLQINALGPAALAAYAHRQRAKFVFFSSDYVFEGSGERPGPYDETSPTCPLSVYGRSKREGEQRVLDAHPSALVVRTTVVYGPDAAGKNFLYTILRNLWSRKPVRVAADQISTPTYNRDLAEAVLALVEGPASGVVHVAGPELMDRLQFAEQVAAYFGLDASLIEGVSTASLGQIAHRPLFSGLATRRLDEFLPGFRCHTLRVALDGEQPGLQRFLETLPEPSSSPTR